MDKNHLAKQTVLMELRKLKDQYHGYHTDNGVGEYTYIDHELYSKITGLLSLLIQLLER